jgi:acetyltransferase EpsM
MMSAVPVIIPLINPNENEARLVALHAKPGQKVKAGALLATLETTKSTFELAAEKSGYVLGIPKETGVLLKTGEILCYLASTKTWKAPKDKPVPTSVPEGLRITQPALQLAQQGKLDLSLLPIGPIVTESHVQKILGKGKKPGSESHELEQRANDYLAANAAKPRSVVVYGGGGHGKAVIHLLQAVGGYVIAGVIDDGKTIGDSVLDAMVIGGANSLPAVQAAGCKLAVNAVGGIGAMSSRIVVFDKLIAAGFGFPNLIHPSAVVEPDVHMAAATQVFPQAYVGSTASIGLGCIINTGAIVSHDCILEDYVNLAPGAILAGGVQVGTGTLIGMGVTVNLNVRIGARARIGNGATLKEDVPEGGIVRAGAVWPG